MDGERRKIGRVWDDDDMFIVLDGNPLNVVDDDDEKRKRRTRGQRRKI